MEGSARAQESGCCAPSESLEDAGAPQPRVLKIRGYDVRFPHKPYPVQIAMMDKTIQALKNSQNVLLELPTGSGKSLSLLCAAAAWHEGTVKQIQEEALQKSSACDTASCEEDAQKRRDKAKRPPKIYIASRTHAQLAQLGSSYFTWQRSA